MAALDEVPQPDAAAVDEVPQPDAAALDEVPQPDAAALDAAADAERLGRLADEELPALIARFEQSGLGELEIHRQDWRIRLRRSATTTAAAKTATRPTHRGRGHMAKEQPPSQPAGGSGPRDPGAPGSAAALLDGGHPGALAAVGPGRGAEEGTGRRRVATSPAVGYFSPLDALASGHQVRSGDLLGHVDVLGVRQEVVAPMDGIVVRVLAEPGQAVEYGEGLIRVDAMRRTPETSDPAEGSEVARSSSAPTVGTSAPSAPTVGTSAPSAPTVGTSAPSAEGSSSASVAGASADGSVGTSSPSAAETLRAGAPDAVGGSG